MHTLQFEDDVYGTIRVHHNGDWSGIVTISFVTQSERPPLRVPGLLLRKIAGETVLAQVRSKLTAFIEDLQIDSPP